MTIANCDHLIDLIRNNLSDNKYTDDAEMHHIKCTNKEKRFVFLFCRPKHDNT